MPSYVAFLRAVNVGGRFVRMADLRGWLAESGLAEVQTHIQTGNVRFTSAMRSRARVEAHLEETLGRACGFEVATMVRPPAELRAAHREALALGSPLPGEPRRYLTFLKHPAPDEAAAELDAWDADGERVRVCGSHVHWWLAKPFHEARLSNARLERTLGAGTTRDLKVVATLAERWGA